MHVNINHILALISRFTDATGRFVRNTLLVTKKPIFKKYQSATLLFCTCTVGGVPG